MVEINPELVLGLLASCLNDGVAIRPRFQLGISEWSYLVEGPVRAAHLHRQPVHGGRCVPAAVPLRGSSSTVWFS